MKAKPLLILLGTIMSAEVARAALSVGVVYPPGALEQDGNTWLNPSDFDVRFQQVFDASLFSALPSGGADLDSLYFRADSFQGRRVDVRVTGVQIKFSTTTRDASSLSPVFAENEGRDAKVVVSRDQSRTVAIGLGGGLNAVAPFFALFATAGPFFHYDPAKGNLLLDITGLYLDSFLDGVSGDHPLSVWQRFGEKEGRVVNQGLVTAFSFVIPEPSGMGLLGLGAGLAAVAGLASSSKRKDSDVASGCAVSRSSTIPYLGSNSK